MGGGICPKVRRLRVLRHQRGGAERAFPLLHQGSGTRFVLFRDHRLPHRSRHRHRPSGKERDTAQHTADARPEGVHTEAHRVRQDRQCHRTRTTATERERGESEDAHRHRLRPKDVARHAAHRSAVLWRRQGQQGHPLRRYDCEVLQ